MHGKCGIVRHITTSIFTLITSPFLNWVKKGVTCRVQCIDCLFAAPEQKLLNWRKVSVTEVTIYTLEAILELATWNWLSSYPYSSLSGVYVGSTYIRNITVVVKLWVTKQRNVTAWSRGEGTFPRDAVQRDSKKHVNARWAHNRRCQQIKQDLSMPPSRLAYR